MSAVALAAGTTGLTLVAPIEGPLRVVPAVVFVLALPGYLATCALFPRVRDLSGPDRVALSLGLSMAIVPLVGLALNFSPWGIRLAPVVLSIDVLAVMLAFATFRRAASLPGARTSTSRSRSPTHTVRHRSAS